MTNRRKEEKNNQKTNWVNIISKGQRLSEKKKKKQKTKKRQE